MARVSVRPISQDSSSASRKLRTIATPPPLGVGTLWELRSLGTSITLRARA